MQAGGHRFDPGTLHFKSPAETHVSVWSARSDLRWTLRRTPRGLARRDALGARELFQDLGSPGGSLVGPASERPRTRHRFLPLKAERPEVRTSSESGQPTHRSQASKRRSARPAHRAGDGRVEVFLGGPLAVGATAAFTVLVDALRVRLVNALQPTQKRSVRRRSFGSLAARARGGGGQSSPANGVKRGSLRGESQAAGSSKRPSSAGGLRSSCTHHCSSRPSAKTSSSRCCHEAIEILSEALDAALTDSPRTRRRDR